MADSVRTGPIVVPESGCDRFAALQGVLVKQINGYSEAGRLGDEDIEKVVDRAWLGRIGGGLHSAGPRSSAPRHGEIVFHPHSVSSSRPHRVPRSLHSPDDLVLSFGVVQIRNCSLLMPVVQLLQSVRGQVRQGRLS